MSHIRTSYPDDRTPDNFFSDLEWILANETDLLKRYGESSIFVYRKSVIGVGSSYFEALNDAKNATISGSDEITPVHYHLVNRAAMVGAFGIRKKA